MLFGQIYGNLSQKHLFTFSNTLEKDMQLCYNICVSISEDGGCIMTFAEKVKEARKQLGLSQEKFAGKMGVSFSTINRWEKDVSFQAIWLRLNLTLSVRIME